MHVLADETSETPESYGQAFRLLADHDIVDQDLAGRLSDAAGLRNILVHGCLDVDLEVVWSHLGRLDDLRRFAAIIQQRLKR